jgi:hypothetical protein
VTDSTIKLAEAVRLMRQVSRVTANELRERDASGRWKNFPAIRRYQQAAGGRGKRGAAILVERADVLRWVAEQREIAEAKSRPIQAAPEGSINTYQDIFPTLAAMGAHKTIRALSGASRHKSKLREAA